MRKMKKLIRFIALMLVFSTTTVTMVTVNPTPAQAACCSCCSCISSVISTDITNWIQDLIEIDLHLFINILIHQITWFDWTFWQQHMLPLFMQTGTQFAAVGTLQVTMIGQFMDAQQQLETQRVLQKLHARATKDYMPTTGMCEFGTRVMGLAATERKGEAASLILTRRSTARFLGNTGVAAAGGSEDDIVARFRQFSTTYCNPHDNNGSMAVICYGSMAAANALNANDRARINADINYERTLWSPKTVQTDLTDDNPTDTEIDDTADEDIFALANNLYGFEIYDRMSPNKMGNRPDGDISGAQTALMNVRAATAKTKVAENSYNAIVGLKTEGTGASIEFIQAYLRELGIRDYIGFGDDYIEEFLGENPSYDAQMELLTKTAYQSSLFYTNLYESPANVERKGVAMQAIGLMQKFDLLKSHLRTEASLSILLELAVEQLQREIEDNIRATDINSGIFRQ